MVKVQKIAPYNFEFRKISVLSSQTDCSFTIGFQDSLDAFLLAIMPSCWDFKADL